MSKLTIEINSHGFTQLSVDGESVGMVQSLEVKSHAAATVIVVELYDHRDPGFDSETDARDRYAQKEKLLRRFPGLTLNLLPFEGGARCAP